ncbi:hypothetical protein PENANT_c018G03111 [Penicillium antarcticum]|uniref:Uncharacterized protein n=1 Tax=Penicillium antarcticum TaxID=416450 RepID=A0A1V6Q2G1_9EURO|nr:uncharacterized protein N7508_003776 [Penicillium antarcticum]KAJ5312946.1 hypothetical protein N7508_003776 [Penicillium antarcticum]OQD83062.1 hypothetical protein PENANT_c018G03111 [Penicillium antarcticum]
MADPALSLYIPETAVSGMSSLLESGLDTSVSSSSALLSSTISASDSGIAGPVFDTVASAASSAEASATVNFFDPAPFAMPDHWPVLSTHILSLPTVCTSTLDRVQPVAPGTLDQSFSWSSPDSSRFGGLGIDADTFSNYSFKSVEHQGMGHGVQQLCQLAGPADDVHGMAGKSSASKPDHAVGQGQQQHLRAQSMRQFSQTPVPAETHTPVTLPGMEMLGGLLMVDNQGDQVPMDSAQAQMSQAHSLRAGIQKSEAQKAQSRLQRFQRAHSQQPVVPLPADSESDVARASSSARLRRRHAMSQTSERPSLFQQVLTELNAASEVDNLILPHPGAQLPRSTIGRDALVESEGYPDSRQPTRSGLDSCGRVSSVDDHASQRASGQRTLSQGPPFHVNSASDLILASGHAQASLQGHLPQHSVQSLSSGDLTALSIDHSTDVSAGLSTGLPTVLCADLSNELSNGLSAVDSLILAQAQAHRALPPNPVGRLPTSCNPSLAKREPVLSFPLPPPVSLEDRAPSSPENCKWRQGGVPTHISAPFDTQLSMDPIVPYIAHSSAHNPVASGDLLARLSRDDILDIKGNSQNRNPNYLGDCHSQVLGSVVVSNLGDSQVLFIFNMFGLIANLQPRFEYKYGGSNGKRIGVKLILWGHTVLIEPVTQSLHDARVNACREALEQLRVFNMLWQIPPQPMDGPTSPSWNWVEVLEVYRAAQKWPEPEYQPFGDGNSWHCDVFVERKLYRTMKPVPTRDEAENTVAHLAMYQMMVGKGKDKIPSCILPADTAVMVTVPIQKQINSLLRSISDAEKSLPTVEYAGVKKPIILPKFIAATQPQTASKKSKSRAAKRAALQKAQQNSWQNAQNAYNAQQNTWQNAQRNTQWSNRQDIPVYSNAPTANNNDCPASVSNMIPVTDARLVPLEVREEPTKGPLITLRKFAKVFGRLDEGASFTTILGKLCHALKASQPRVRCIPAPEMEDKHENTRAVVARFSDSHPYLNRASPIHLAYVVTNNVDAARSLGIKHLILYILNMAKEDAGMEDTGYSKELCILQALEEECKRALNSFDVRDDVFYL